MRRMLVVGALLVGTLVTGAPAGALSCVPPEPIEWENRFPQLEAAFVVEIERVAEVTIGTLSGSLHISGAVVEVFKGSAGAHVEYTVPALNPWGPYYEPGDLVAVIVDGGVISDGRQNICGPWFEPTELQRAAELYGDPDPPRKPEPPPADPPEQPKLDEQTPPPEGPATEPPPTEARRIAPWAMLLEFLRLILQVLGLR